MFRYVCKNNLNLVYFKMFKPLLHVQVPCEVVVVVEVAVVVVVVVVAAAAAAAAAVTAAVGVASFYKTVGTELKKACFKQYSKPHLQTRPFFLTMFA